MSTSSNINSLEESFVSVHEKSEIRSSSSKHDTKEEHTQQEQQIVDEHSAFDSTRPRRLDLSAREADLLPTLKARLAGARFPDQIESAGWGYGMESSLLKSLTQEWLHQYDWNKELEQLNNDYEHWTCRVNGLDVHFVHHDPWARAAGEGEGEEFTRKPFVNDSGEIIMPLLLIHGWPAPTQKGFGVRDMAKTLHELMQRLGYKYYLAQGGDWGAILSRTLATLYPEHCLAIHLNMLPCLPPRPWTRPFQFAKAIAGILLPSVVYRKNPREAASVNTLKKYAVEEGAYFFVQATKPQTLGHALNDSPVGLLSWLGEKYLAWADLDPLKPDTWPFTKTELLTQVMIYHSTQTITSSIRIYYEAYHNRDVEWLLRQPVPTSVPVGVGVWNKELFMVPKAWADDWMNIVSWHEFPKGGHFAAFERPVEFEKEIAEYFTQDDILDLFTAKRRGLKI
ncbi:hypothetical protein BGZ99_007628 [Dissophora globulifera]|uniref:Epoxide hydrolase N-terminal domain-containing protein n=1 Tax=Dissophora globulifera TaxID=979702 RepID=A0A9P6UQR3_9FUNG|nr:hypothetical protein BGZ99_007628 [Dissophora globulifera]